ncbi:hypothetical protein PGTUg99_035216 [Puccinia graminis f. sp. tritici]|uniref:Secreted protein n=1 Tax=Puccinia graminis f. sp. tritici TaxID=56615 RepID=A0A5B0RNY1_PUCGR|nr:hypothetical protein PGTUg99_035216 [Puccinia graminis f. sp. tritici]
MLLRASLVHLLLRTASGLDSSSVEKSSALRPSQSSSRNQFKYVTTPSREITPIDNAKGSLVKCRIC